MNNYLVNMDSFGDNCPTNWEEIAAFLNPMIEKVIDELGDEAEDWEIQDETNKIWDAFCNGEIKDCPEPIF